MIPLDPQHVFKRKIYNFNGEDFLQNDPKIAKLQKVLKAQQGLLLVSSSQF